VVKDYYTNEDSEDEGTNAIREDVGEEENKTHEQP
jgi:hypothetical protein